MIKKIYKTKSLLILTTLTLLSLGGVTQSKYSKSASVNVRVDQVAKASSAGTYNYTITKAGYYLVQMKGGDGGYVNKANTGSAGRGGFVEAMYYFNVGQTIRVNVGTKGLVSAKETASAGVNSPQNTARGGLGGCYSKNISDSYGLTSVVGGAGGGLTEMFFPTTSDTTPVVVVGGGGGGANAKDASIYENPAVAQAQGGGGGSIYNGQSSPNGADGQWTVRSGYKGKIYFGNHNIYKEEIKLIGADINGRGGTSSSAGVSGSGRVPNEQSLYCTGNTDLDATNDKRDIIVYSGNTGSGRDGGSTGIGTWSTLTNTCMSGGGGGGSGYYGGGGGFSCKLDYKRWGTYEYEMEMLGYLCGGGGGGSTYLNTGVSQYVTNDCLTEIRCLAELGGYTEPLRNRPARNGTDAERLNFLSPENAQTEDPTDGAFNMYYVGKSYSSGNFDDCKNNFSLPEFLK